MSRVSYRCLVPPARSTRQEYSLPSIFDNLCFCCLHKASDQRRLCECFCFSWLPQADTVSLDVSTSIAGPLVPYELRYSRLPVELGIQSSQGLLCDLLQ